MTAPWNLYLGTCDATGKRMYSERSTAKKVAREMRGRGLTTYRCDDCGHWHIGHRSVWTREQHRQHRKEGRNG